MVFFYWYYYCWFWSILVSSKATKTISLRLILSSQSTKKHDNHQVTIAVPDVGDNANGQLHHHLVGEKPRFCLYFGKGLINQWLSRFQGPSAQASFEEEQGPVEIPGDSSNEWHHGILWFYFHHHFSQTKLDCCVDSVYAWALGGHWNVFFLFWSCG